MLLKKVAYVFPIGCPVQGILGLCYEGCQSPRCLQLSNVINLQWNYFRLIAAK